MKTPGWDAASARALRAADALFDTADLGWFHVLTRPWDGNPWFAFERLISDALAPGTRKEDAAELLRPAHTLGVPRPLSTIARPVSRAVSGIAPLAPDAPQLSSPTLPTTSSHAGQPAQLASVTQAARRIDGPAFIRAARAATPDGRFEVASPRIADGLVEPADAPGSRLRADDTGPAPSRATEVASPTPQAPGTAGSLRVLRLPRALRGSVAAAPVAERASTAPFEPVPVEGLLTHASPAQPKTQHPTRLVEGLPALQNLLQAAVVESRERHTRSSVDTVPARPDVPPASPMSAPVPAEAPALRALPQLDPVAEDMLVDRLADRLEERMREQALRQFGFTGGLT